ncbi:transporter [Candidatus Parcubacteria bacterium]|nr:transporter [Candidatus Parcubacteria bacterium]
METNQTTDAFSGMVSGFLQMIPAIVGALAVLLIGYLVALVAKTATRRGLGRAGLDRSVADSPAGSMVHKVTASPSAFLGALAFWAVFIGAISLAVSVLGIPALTSLVAAVYAYLPNVLAALIIFLVAVAVSAGASGLATRTMGDTPTGKVIATVIPALVMSVAAFMMLSQLRIAPAIVTITFAALIGSLALGMALAFGLGGREVAGRILEQAYQKGQANMAQARQDLQQGKERSRQLAAEMKQKTAGQEQTDQASEREQRRGWQAQPTFGEVVDSRFDPDDQR